MNSVNIGQIADFINGYPFKPTDWQSSGKKIIRIQNLTDNSKNFNFTKKEIPQKYLIQKGDLLISWSATLGIFEWLNDEPALLNQHIFKVVFKKDIDKSFFKFAIRGAIEGMKKYTHGSTMKHIVKEDFVRTGIPLLSLESQKQAANILDLADSLRQKRKEAISLLDNYLKSVFLEMFGDPVTNPKGWDIEALNFFGEIVTGNTPPRNNNDNYSPNFIEWIKTDNIIDDQIYLTKASEYLSESGLNRARSINPGAVLMACIAGSIASIGRVAITDRKVSFNQQINAIQPNERVNSFFLYWLFRISRLYIQNHATKGMKRILTKGEFEKIIMIIPSLDLQSKFAEIAQSAEIIKQKMLTQEEQLDNQFQSMMQKYFASN